MKLCLDYEWRDDSVHVVVMEAHQFVVNGKVMTIPKMFVSDGASSPRICWRICPKIDKYIECYIEHDWLYSSHAVTRKEADKHLYDSLIGEGMNKLCAMSIYVNVRMFGRSHW